MNQVILQNSVLALQDHCSYKAPTKKHIKQSRFSGDWLLEYI